MSRVILKDIVKDYGEARVIRGINLEVRDGEFLVFVGPSGCGKSTMLRMIAGLEEVTSGELWIDDRLSNDVHPSARGAAMVFQNYALYPHMTVADNMGFSLKIAGRKKSEVDAAVGQAATLLRLESMLGKYPRELSGGQRQRVAIGRAIVRKPKVFLFDEPLSNLDASLRVQMRVELSRLHAELGTTMIYVTHDQVEAMTMGDRIAVFDGGRISQVGTPMEIYFSPDNEFVASFMGSPRINLLNVSVDHAGVLVLGQYRLAGSGPLPDSAAVARRLGVRAEHVGFGQTSGIPGVVELCEHLGGEVISYVRIDGGSELLAVRRAASHGVPARGERVLLDIDLNHALFFDERGCRIA